MNIYEKLSKVQTMLKAPKSQYNSFGKYSYRSCEDILEAVKPLCKEQKLLLTISDEIIMIGQRFYTKATATIRDIEKPDDTVIVTSFAREEEGKKGMDGSQVTGASSSYARKYALNGLFNIDDTKDSDSTNNGFLGKDPAKHEEQEEKTEPATAQQMQYVLELINKCAELKQFSVQYINTWLENNMKKPVQSFTKKDVEIACKALNMQIAETVQKNSTDGMG